MAEYGDSIPITLLMLLLLVSSGNGNHHECGESSCGSYEPSIRFPFQLIRGSHDECSNPSFCLYCNKHKNTMILLQTTSGPIEFLVEYIDYETQRIDLSDPENCIAKKILKLNSSSFLPYRWPIWSNNVESVPKLIFFNCSTVGTRHLRNIAQTEAESQDMITCPIYLSYSYDSILELDLVSCTRMFDINPSVVAFPYASGSWLCLNWPNQNCSECEAKGKKCRWKKKNNNSTKGVTTECYDCKKKRKTIHIPKSSIFAATGSILLGMVIIVFCIIHLHLKKKEEDQTRVDKFLEDYRAQKPARFAYADIKRITSGFKEKIGEGAHGTVFKGKLSNEILVAVKILNNTHGGEGKEFINEVGIMGKIHHINVVRLLGFCAEGIHRALVYNLFPNGSLQSFIFPPDNIDLFLGWEKIQHISLGIAKGIEYLHEGCNHPIVHFDINPHNVLLDENFTPKISDFGLAKLCSKNPSVISMTTAKGTLGYMAPEVFSRNFGNVSLKSDIYSYGMLLLEMVGGRKNMDTSSAETFQVLYPDWIHNLLDGDIHIHIDGEGDVKIAKKLAIVGLWCIQWQPVNRPSIKSVVQMLETREENQLIIPPNPFNSKTSTATSEHTFARQAFQLEAIQE